MTELPIPLDEAYKIVRKALTKYKAHVRTMTEFEDLVQLTLIKTFEVLDKYDKNKGGFSNFLYMQASWTLWRQDLHEKGKGRRKFLTSYSLDKTIEGYDDNMTLIETIDDKHDPDDSWKLELILERLEPEEIELLNHTTFAGRTVSQVAREKEISQTRLNNKHIKIRKKIRRLLDEGIF